MNYALGWFGQVMSRSGIRKWAAAIAISMLAGPLHAQSEDSATLGSGTESPQAMQGRIDKLEAEVAELKSMVKQLQVSAQPASTPAAGMAVTAAPRSPVQSGALTESDSAPVTVQQSVLQSEDRKALDFLRDTTINLSLDTYYAYNFNHPVGRVNLLRAYDVLSNEFSLNQASVVLERAPDLSVGRRWGARLDLQYGQATDTLQGNPSNEPRPDIYRNIFQAYGTYIAPIGRGVSIDFGKWSSSLGIEGNYTKDQIDYSRSYWFNFLPFYHMGVRVNMPVNDRFTVNYWIVNGTNQVEATNGFKDELFGFSAKPSKSVSWTFNYYLGQDHPDRVVVAPAGPIPVQPGLSFEANRPAPDGLTHIFDSYVTWQATPKLTVALESDYFIQRLWRNEAAGQSSAPSHVDGGAAYIKYQFTPKMALATRAEYLSDHGGLFSGLNQALKENTVTFDYAVAPGFLMRYEWRVDYSNQPSFLSDLQGVLTKQQNTATLGVVWWWGGKEGAW